MVVGERIFLFQLEFRLEEIKNRYPLMKTTTSRRKEDQQHHHCTGSQEKKELVPSIKQIVFLCNRDILRGYKQQTTITCRAFFFLSAVDGDGIWRRNRYREPLSTDLSAEINHKAQNLILPFCDTRQCMKMFFWSQQHFVVLNVWTLFGMEF